MTKTVTQSVARSDPQVSEKQVAVGFDRLSLQDVLVGEQSSHD